MEIALTVLAGVAALAWGLVAGVQLSGTGASNRALRTLDVRTYLLVKRSFDGAFPVLMRPLLLGSLALSALCCAVAAMQGRPGPSLAAAVSLVAGVVVLVAVLGGDVPINRRMAQWDVTSPPQDWQVVRRGWEQWFSVRTAASGAAFVAALVAAMLGG